VMLLVPRVSSSAGVPSLVATGLGRKRWWHVDTAATQIDVHPTLVLLCGIVQPHLAAHLLDTRLDLLHMAYGVVPLSDNNVQVRLASSLGVSDAHFQDVLGFLHKLPMEIDRIVGDAALRIVLPEDELRSLLVIRVFLLLMCLSFIRERFGFGLVPALVRLMSLEQEIERLVEMSCVGGMERRGLSQASRKLKTLRALEDVPGQSMTSSCLLRTVPDHVGDHIRPRHRCWRCG
jgi:hypothetical protein